MIHTVTIERLSKKIRGTVVLQDVGMRLESGKVYGLVGDNGSGKTMLMRAICGLILPDSGEIRFEGESRAARNPTIGAMIENTSLYPDLTGIENLQLLAKIRRQIGRNQIQAAIKRVGLDPGDKRTYRKYSLGMKQRLLLAQAIMEQPDLLLLDEPSNALDQEGVAMVHQVMHQEAGRGAIVLLASHIQVDIRSHCARVYQMEHGVLQEVSP
ncbi:MAG TPA: ABC transporter ATP-binding protein [Candidatus Faecousia gallistercoris]|nr:ABC transporter ATP-binding protein [Candidatus Faecousia gallistercoris]